MLELCELQLSRGTEHLISAQISPGTVTWISGPNGVGKSTLLHTVLGELLPASGTVRVSGTSVAELTVQQRSGTFAFASQFATFTAQLTVGRIVSLYGGTREDSTLHALDLKQLWDITIDRMSGGELQRLGIAVAVIRNAPYVLLDEPLASQDAKSRERILTLLQREAVAGRAVIVTSHIPVPAAVALSID